MSLYSNQYKPVTRDSYTSDIMDSLGHNVSEMYI